jgi:hypothetical protein
MQITTHTEHRWVVVGFDGLTESIDELSVEAPVKASNAKVWRDLKSRVEAGSSWATGGRTRAQLIEALACPGETLLGEIEDAKRALEDAVPTLAGRPEGRPARSRLTTALG